MPSIFSTLLKMLPQPYSLPIFALKEGDAPVNIFRSAMRVISGEAIAVVDFAALDTVFAVRADVRAVILIH